MYTFTLICDETTPSGDTEVHQMTHSKIARACIGGLVLAATHSPVGLENAAELKLGAVA